MYVVSVPTAGLHVTSLSSGSVLVLCLWVGMYSTWDRELHDIGYIELVLLGSLVLFVIFCMVCCVL